MIKTLFLALMMAALTLWAHPLMALEASEPQASEPTPSEAIKKLAEANAAFALALYGQLAKPEGNLFFSPLSVSAVLALVHQGAKGETKSQIEKTLRFPLEATETPAQSMAALSSYLEKRAKWPEINLKQDNDSHKYDEEDLKRLKNAVKIELNLANSLWPKVGLKIQPDYLKSLGENPPIFEVDYANDGQGAKTKINDWIADKTKGKIKNFLGSPPPPQSSLILVNAVYFLGQWTFPFNAELTKPHDFVLASGEKVEVPFLNQTKTFNYLEIDEGQILELPYGAQDFSFLILLPANKPSGLLELEKKLSQENLNNWRESLTQKRVIVSMPKFKTTWGTNSLTKPLIELGLKAPFQAGADFSGLVLNDNLLISDVMQKAFVSLDESGTEAAAASAFLMATSAMINQTPPSFVADRPFIFLIQEKTTNSILFMGRLADPRS
ncbi:MAG: serpin family protein [Deltaproteobacteria bacterium]|jgi:serpin B|nr:serpin family protein [Deltaproteobacteria bacterium]